MPLWHSTITQPESHCLQRDMGVLTDNNNGGPCWCQQERPSPTIPTLANLTMATTNNSDNDVALLPHHHPPAHLLSPPHDEAERRGWWMTMVRLAGDNNNGRQRWQVMAATSMMGLGGSNCEQWSLTTVSNIFFFLIFVLMDHPLPLPPFFAQPARWGFFS